MMMMLPMLRLPCNDGYDELSFLTLKFVVVGVVSVVATTMLMIEAR
jgi:hypothetical protein